MPDLNRRLPPVPVSTFAMVPRSDVPRSKFKATHSYKTTFNAAVLVPFFTEEVLPGDSFSGKVTMFCRMATPIFPIMDNLYLETFFFFVPNRIVWDNWVKFMGEQVNPADSIDYTIPQITSLNASGFEQFYLGDYFGLPVESTQTTVALSVNALPFRCYNRIYNEWFRDENLINSIYDYTGDATQTEANYFPRRRAKRPDYFTSALPWPLKGGVEVALPLGESAPVRTASTNQVTGANPGMTLLRETDGASPGAGPFQVYITSSELRYSNAAPSGVDQTGLYPSNLYADLSDATGNTINALRLAVASQQFLEKDARGGTRYAELLRNHFGVTPQDARLQRPEYIGGGSNMFQTQAIPQTSASDLTGSETPIGSLGGTTIGTGSHSFSYSASEHGWIIGLVNVRADITYQQGIHRSFTRQTRFDYYWPTFAFLGEQIIRNDEIYATGVVATDEAAFGYQERWAEYRYRPSRITGMFRSNPATGTLDAWHLSQNFTTAPALNQQFIEDYSNAQVERVVAAGATASGQQFLLDSVWNISATRALPARSVPGLTRF